MNTVEIVATLKFNNHYFECGDLISIEILRTAKTKISGRLIEINRNVTEVKDAFDKVIHVIDNSTITVDTSTQFNADKQCIALSDIVNVEHAL